MTKKLKAALIKAAIVLVPSYTAAFLTDKMVYVVPTLAAAGLFAAVIKESDLNRLLDDTENDGAQITGNRAVKTLNISNSWKSRVLVKRLSNNQIE